MLRFYFALITLFISVALFFAMLLSQELGRRLGLRMERNRGPDSKAGVGVVDSAVYALLGLLIGFMFSGAAGRFDARRHMIADEVNIAGTAWQRIDLLPDDLQAPVRDAFRRYVDEIIAWYRTESLEEALHEPPRVTRARNELWARSVAATKGPEAGSSRVLLLPSVNEMFGAVEKEEVARRTHPPVIVFVMLAIAALASALFAGYGMASGTARNWIYMVGIAATISLATYVILELEYPRLGLERIDPSDQMLIDLRTMMGP